MNAWIYGRYSQFLTWIGDQMLALEPPKTRAEQIVTMMKLVEPGDIICRRYTYYLDSIFIPGEFSHSGIMTKYDQMAHSIAEGCLYIHPIDFIKDTDGFIICRPYYSTPFELRKAIKKAVWHVEENKTKYDFTFKDTNRFYCHEFIVDCLNSGGIEIPMYSKTFGVWPFRFQRELYLADGIIGKTKEIYKFEG
jgi:hypothetical protein